MRVFIKCVRDAKRRCRKCRKAIEFGQHFTIERVALKGTGADLKMSYTLASFHFPNCEHPRYGFGDDGMGKSYVV